VRVSAYEWGDIGGTVDIIDGSGWSSVRIKGTRSQVIAQIVKLQHDLALSLTDVMGWDA
jgi:hypothetical protein